MIAARARPRRPKTCLAKDPEDRWQSAHDLEQRAHVDRRGRLGGGHRGSGRRRRGRERIAWLPWAAALVLAAAGFAAGRLFQRAPEAAVFRASIDLPPQLDLERNNASVALSPDGTTLALAATGADGRRLVWVRRMDGFGVQPLPGTDDAMIPFWSPDGRSIGFFAERKLKRVPAAGGVVQTICEAADGRGASWGVDDVIVFAPAPFGGLWKVSAAGGTATPLTRTDKPGATHRLPFFLPDGKRLLYFSGAQTSDKDKQSAIEVLDLATGKSTLVARENSEGRYAEPGYLLFVREGNLMAQPLDRVEPEDHGRGRSDRRGRPVSAVSLVRQLHRLADGTARLSGQRCGAPEPAHLVRRRREGARHGRRARGTSSHSRSRPTPGGPP